MRQKKQFFIILCAMAAVLFVCQPALSKPEPKYGGTAVIGINTDVPTLDPHTTTAFITSIVVNHIFEGLVAHGDNLEFVPVLAERWETSDDLKTYTFYLRKGKLFHNGREMVADDVKYSMERIIDPNTGNPRRSIFKNIANIEVVDKYTVRFHMNETDASLLFSLSTVSPLMAIVPKEEVEKQGGVLKHPVGTGPYKFVEWKPDRYILMERFDDYKSQPGPMNGYGGERIAYLDKIKWVPVPEESVATMALLNKEIDFQLYVPFKNVEKYRTDYAKRGIVLEESPGLSWYEIWFGCTEPITKDVRFRKACAYAIDRTVVADAATRGYCVVNPSFIPTQSQYYSDVHKKWYKKDTEKAKKLLEECGYKGEEISFITTKKYNMMYAQSVAVQAELAAVGINAKLEVLDWPTLLERFFQSGGKFQIASFGMSPRPDPALAYLEARYTNFDKIYPRMAEIRDEASKTLDFETRKKLFEEAHMLTYEGIPGIIFYNYNYFNAMWDYLKGFKFYCTNQPRFWNCWLDK